MIQFIRRQTIFRLVLISIMLVTLVPISLLGVHLYQSAWDNSWREIREKHQLLAENLAAPISIYVDDHRNQLALLANSLGVMYTDRGYRDASFHLLSTSLHHLAGFRSLVYVDTQGRTVALARTANTEALSPELFATEKCYLMSKATGKWSFSRIKPSPFTGEPSLFMGQPVYDKLGVLLGVLLGELRIDLIEALRTNIKFGERGHAAIVDQAGHVIAHPNPDWMAEMRDISDWPIVKAMLAGTTGVTEFYSPFIGDDMVAGYAAVPEIGWGVMVPQPKTEVSTQVARLMRSNIAWGLAGLMLAILFAVLLARRITRPINCLAGSGQALLNNDLDGEISKNCEDAPREIRQLGSVVRSLVQRLQQSRQEVTQLNASLQSRVEEATQQLREANIKLERSARRDYLTSLANRRHFEKTISDMLSRRRSDGDTICIMLIDVDHFKQINDHYGHAAGDTVLTQVARLLESTMRPGDLVARYGGDEFVAQLRCSKEVSKQRAAQIREGVEKQAIQWRDKTIHVTVSVGLYCKEIRADMDVESLLHAADVAMYTAKRNGRNNVVDLSRN